MNLDRVRIFLAVVDEGTVQAAAHAVHLTQPAVSRSLRVLQDELGAQLFERRGRRLVLTSTGRALVAPARELLSSADKLERDVRATARRGYHDLRLGTVDSIGTYVLPKVIRGIRTEFEQIGLKFTTRRTPELFAGLASGQLDLAIIASSGPPPVSPHTRIVEYDMQFYGHREVFSALAHVATEDGLRRFPIVQIEPRPGQPTMVDETDESYALTASLASVKALILGGFGVGALLDFMLSPAERAQLVTAKIPHDPECALYVVRSAQWVAPRAAEIEAFVASAVREALGA